MIKLGRATPNQIRYTGLFNGQVLELVRVALNGKQNTPTSKFVAVSMRLLKKQKPMLKMLVSYADITNQNHKGVIYQATNWLYDGISRTGKDAYYIVDGKLIHGRSMRARYGSKDNFPEFTESDNQSEKGGAIPTGTHHFFVRIRRKNET